MDKSYSSNFESDTTAYMLGILLEVFNLYLIYSLFRVKHNSITKQTVWNSTECMLRNHNKQQTITAIRLLE